MTNNNIQGQQPKQTPALLQKNITDQVISRLTGLQKEGLVVPPNYSPANALKSAWFKIQEAQSMDKKPALEVCTQESIANALLDMAIQGLSPAKNQCYFVVYGNKLQMMRSYFGTQVVLKRLKEVNNVWANVIYQGDTFDYENREGRDFLVKHETKFENRDNPIIGAYGVIVEESGEKPITVMTKKEIETAWNQSKTNQAVHKKFPQEMAKRTVINRAAKPYINTSDDSDILIESINRTTANEYQEDERIDKANAVDAEIQEKANSIEFTPSVTITVDQGVEKIKVNDTTGEVIEEPQGQEAPAQTGWDL